LAIVVPAVAQSPLRAGQAGTLHSHRLAGNSYVTVREVLETYQINRGQISVEPDHREIALNGIQHWLNTPVLAARGQLWITSLDVLKTIDPVLRQGRSRSLAPVRLVVLDPAHGGSDSGTRGRRSVEKEMNLDVARRVERIL